MDAEDRGRTGPQGACADLAIVIVSYNTRDMLRACLAALPAASGGLAIQTFVVDNASADGSAQMVADEFPGVDLTAGTTNSGAVDDVAAASEVCRRHQLWLHVDGAYGGAAIFSDRHRNLVRGIELADSLTIDPHKWLAMPFSAGVILTRHPQVLSRAFGVSTPYMPKDGSAQNVDLFRISTQWSRRMNSLKLWLTLRVHGRQAYEEHIDRQLRLARSFASWVKSSPDYELTVEPALTIVNFRIRPEGRNDEQMAAANNAIVEAVTADGTSWISETRVNGRSVMRMMVISYLTEERHMQSLQQALSQAAAAVHGAAAKKQGS